MTGKGNKTHPAIKEKVQVLDELQNVSTCAARTDLSLPQCKE